MATAVSWFVNAVTEELRCGAQNNASKIEQILLALLVLDNDDELQEEIDMLTAKLVDLFQTVEPEKGKKTIQSYLAGNEDIHYHANGLVTWGRRNFLLPAWPTDYYDNMDDVSLLKSKKKRTGKALQIKALMRTSYLWWYEQLKAYQKKSYVPNENNMGKKMTDLLNAMEIEALLMPEERELLGELPSHELGLGAYQMIEQLRDSEYSYTLRSSRNVPISFLTKSEMDELIVVLESVRNAHYFEQTSTVSEKLQAFKQTVNPERVVIDFTQVNIERVYPPQGNGYYLFRNPKALEIAINSLSDITDDVVRKVLMNRGFDLLPHREVTLVS